MNMTKGALILSLSFLLAACSSIPQNIKGNNQPDIQKSFVAVHNQPGLYVGQQARFGLMNPLMIFIKIINMRRQ